MLYRYESARLWQFHWVFYLRETIIFINKIKLCYRWACALVFQRNRWFIFIVIFIVLGGCRYNFTTLEPFEMIIVAFFVVSVSMHIPKLVVDFQKNHNRAYGFSLFVNKLIKWWRYDHTRYQHILGAGNKLLIRNI